MDRAEHTKKANGSGQKLQWGPITLRPDRRQVRVDGVLLDLSRVEFRLLHLLLQHPGRTFNCAYLEEIVWEDQTGSEQTVYKTIERIKMKLGKHSEIIESVWGAGYRLRGDQ
ncbi:MAG: response regulator transcription factor [Anaerolineae bacterium]|nr:response regulator transcription factor [Anaerolineae bacterium]